MKKFEEMKIEHRLPVINHAAHTIVMSEAFSRAAAEFGSGEFLYLMEIQKVCIGYEIIIRSNRRPRNTEKTRNIKKFVSYDKMEKYIRLLDNKDELLKQLHLVKDFAACHRNAASIVFKWFNDTFPDYRENPRIDKNGKLVARVKIISLEDYKKSIEEAEQAKSLERAPEGENELPEAI